MVGVFRCHSHFPGPTGRPNDCRDGKAGAPINASTAVATVYKQGIRQHLSADLTRELCFRSKVNAPGPLLILIVEDEMMVAPDLIEASVAATKKVLHEDLDFAF